MTKARNTSQRKADANRRNASKSTGPKTAQGKSWSRRNALKHGILASQAVIATIEGHAERKLFEATVEGLAQDFQPVGTYEQLLVQEIAACFWRKRRLLTFENRAAFEVRDRPVTQLVNRYPEEHPPELKSAFYLQHEMLVTTEQVYDDAGLSGITLPSEADTMRVIRYEAAINRTRERAVASLREMKKARRGIADPRAEIAPVVDRAAARRNASRGYATLLTPLFSLNAWRKFEEVAEEAERLREAELRGQLPSEDRESDQTKPKTLSPEEKDRRLKQSIYEVFGVGEPPEASEKAPIDPNEDPNKSGST